MLCCPEVEPVWREIVAGEIRIEFEFLAARILQGVLARSFGKSPSPERLALCARELRDLFLQNKDLPAVRNDLEKVLG